MTPVNGVPLKLGDGMALVQRHPGVRSQGYTALSCSQAHAARPEPGRRSLPELPLAERQDVCRQQSIRSRVGGHRFPDSASPHNRVCVH